MEKNMSEPVKEPERYDPASLRNTIKMALGEHWTRELEDALFWSISGFTDECCRQVIRDQRKHIREALGL